MSAISYMQRRRSGIYEFRRRLPSSLAGRQAPKHVRDAFPELVNAETGRFKLEVVRSLGETDVKAAKRKDHREALKFQELFDGAEHALSQGDLGKAGLSQSDLREIGQEVFAGLLAEDEGEREEGDERRHLQTPDERAQWPDLMRVDPAGRGMLKDHFMLYAG
ncbi:MAG TPA: DUF6538 domain-containing protein, partial [Propylenella sp.]